MPINNRTSFTSHSAGQTITSASENGQQTAINALEDVLAKKPWFSIAENAYAGSAAGNGTTDETTAINAAMTDAANETRGGNLLITPGDHKVHQGGAVGTDGYGLRMLDDVTLWLMPGARIFADSAGYNPIYASGASNIGIVGMGNNLIDGASENVGTIKITQSSRVFLQGLTLRNGRIAFDVYNCTDVLARDIVAYADGSIETANSDTRGVSIAYRNIVGGTTERITLMNFNTYGFATGCRVVADTGGTMRHINLIGGNIKNTTGYGMSIENCTINASNINIETPGQLGLQLLNANRCNLSNFNIRNSGWAGVLLFASTYNKLALFTVDGAGQSAAYYDYELRATGGIGSHHNRLIGCDGVNNAGGLSYVDNVSGDTTSGNNRLIGCSLPGTVSANGSTTQTAAA